MQTGVQALDDLNPATSLPVSRMVEYNHGSK